MYVQLNEFSLKFAIYYSIFKGKNNVTRQFILYTFIFQRTRFMSNAACSNSVDKLYSYLELFYARVYGYQIVLPICKLFQDKKNVS